MIKIHGFTVHHASHLTLRDGTVILPASRQELVFDQGALCFRLVEQSYAGPRILKRYPVAIVEKAGWY